MDFCYLDTDNIIFRSIGVFSGKEKLILMANGESRKANNVQPGDLLIGEDGLPRPVLERVVSTENSKLQRVRFKRPLIGELLISDNYVHSYKSSFVSVLSKKKLAKTRSYKRVYKTSMGL